MSRPATREPDLDSTRLAKLRITEYTDPGCPFAWSAEPSRRRLDWLYGEHLEWEVRMVGLAESPSHYDDIGFTPERQSHSFRRLAQKHGMPMDSSLRPRMSATVPKRAGLDPGAVAGWVREPETEELLASDLAQSRAPSDRALALAHKLAATDDGGEGGYRYTCPSYEIERVPDGAGLAVPGFQPLAAYEVAAVCGIGLDEARERLGHVATEEHVGFDGLWHLNGAGS